MTRLAELLVGGDPLPWQTLGFTVVDGSFFISDVHVRVVGGEPGIRGWVFATDRDETCDIDGIPTELSRRNDAHVAELSPLGAVHAVGLDHVVVNTDDPTRTSAAIERELALDVRRVRELGNGATQTFMKPDNTVIEIVSGPHVTGIGARLWGMVASVDDIHAFAADVTERLGDDVLSTPKPAVQQGRFIATVRSSAGLGVPFAIMSPHVSDPRSL